MGTLADLLSRARPQEKIGDRHLPVLAEHPPTHFHARYGEQRVAVEIATLEVLAGGLPSPAMRLVREWGELHRKELMVTSAHALAHEPLGTIEPLP